MTENTTQNECFSVSAGCVSMQLLANYVLISVVITACLEGPETSNHKHLFNELNILFFLKRKKRKKNYSRLLELEVLAKYCVTSLSVSVYAAQREGGLCGKTLFLSSSSFIYEYIWSVMPSVKTPPPPPPFPSLCNTIIRVGVWIPVHADAGLHLSGGGSQYIPQLFQRFKVCCNLFLQHTKQECMLLD